MFALLDGKMKIWVNVLIHAQMDILSKLSLGKIDALKYALVNLD